MAVFTSGGTGCRPLSAFITASAREPGDPSAFEVNDNGDDDVDKEEEGGGDDGVGSKFCC